MRLFTSAHKIVTATLFLMSYAHASLGSLNILNAEDFIINKEVDKMDNSLKNAYANPIAELSLFNTDSTKFKHLYQPKSINTALSDDEFKTALEENKAYLLAEKEFNRKVEVEKEKRKNTIVIKMDETEENKKKAQKAGLKEIVIKDKESVNSLKHNKVKPKKKK